MSALRYRINIYERQTERVGGVIDVPAPLESRILALAGITRPSDPGEIELHHTNLRAIARLLGFRADEGRYHYYLETLVTSLDRVRD